MTNQELMYAAVMALTRQNVVKVGGGTPKELSIGYLSRILTLRIWSGEIIVDKFSIEN